MLFFFFIITCCKCVFNIKNVIHCLSLTFNAKNMRKKLHSTSNFLQCFLCYANNNFMLYTWSLYIYILKCTFSLTIWVRMCLHCTKCQINASLQFYVPLADSPFFFIFIFIWSLHWILLLCHIIPLRCWSLNRVAVLPTKYVR